MRLLLMILMVALLGFSSGCGSVASFKVGFTIAPPGISVDVTTKSDSDILGGCKKEHVEPEPPADVMN